MIYITMKQSPAYRQMSLEEFLFETTKKPTIVNYNATNTRTYTKERATPEMVVNANIPGLIKLLGDFNNYTASIRSKQRETLYQTFRVPKKGKGMQNVFKQIFALQKKYIGCDTGVAFKQISAMISKILTQHPTELDNQLKDEVVRACVAILKENGFTMTLKGFESIISDSFRRIDEPKEELKGALYDLKSIFEDAFGVLYHTSAFAYIKGRSTLDAIKRHQSNESKWFGKYDLSNFFGSTTVEFIIHMLSMVFPFSEVVKTTAGKEELTKALSICTLGDVLPQGTPISPLITNVMMIPIDHKLSNKLRDFNSQSFTYTRYADDFIISSKYDFKFREVEKLLVDTLAEFEAPFTIKSEKTRYGSSSGSNWNLGVMLNKDNKITVGYKAKRQFQAMLSSYVMDRLNGKRWDISEIMHMEGLRNYYNMVEGETIERIINHLNQKFNVNIRQLIKADLSA